jgi:two-component system, NtrC family, response regulator AtoC
MEGSMPASEMSRRILVLDASATAAGAMARLLGLEGHRVVVAESVTDAHARCEAEGFDLVITDVAFRDGGGLGVLARARAKGAARGIVLTGHEDEAYRVAAAQAGFDAYLLKPVDWQRLRTLIDRLLPARDVDPGREHRAPAACGPTLA